jgi:acyl dehydratase
MAPGGDFATIGPCDGIAVRRGQVTGQPKFHWEDFPVGETVEFGNHRVTAEEIVAFAAEFDPQPFHLDDAAAKATLLGGLAASGWHTCAIMMRMLCDGYVLQSASMGAPGLDEVRWLKPVRPGDVLRIRRTCVESRPSRSRPEMGLTRFTWDMYNQAGDHVMTATGTSMLGRRTPGASP